jgi:hypothetical protein
MPVLWVCSWKSDRRWWEKVLCGKGNSMVLVMVTELSKLL